MVGWTSLALKVMDPNGTGSDEHVKAVPLISIPSCSTVHPPPSPSVHQLACHNRPHLLLDRLLNNWECTLSLFLLFFCQKFLCNNYQLWVFINFPTIARKLIQCTVKLRVPGLNIDSKLNVSGMWVHQVEQFFLMRFDTVRPSAYFSCVVCRATSHNVTCWWRIICLPCRTSPNMMISWRSCWLQRRGLPPPLLHRLSSLGSRGQLHTNIQCRCYSNYLELKPKLVVCNRDPKDCKFFPGYWNPSLLMTNGLTLPAVDEPRH